tara:strand:- start:670 stop:1032 length:363 start_codon:yes stop_codon:yes gene_type:complete
MKLKKKQLLLRNRRYRIRKKINGTSERPRLVVTFSEKHIYAQLINDIEGKTVLFTSTLSKDKRDEKLSANIAGATILGKDIGEKALKQGISSIVFDRGGKKYHGVVKAFADAARESGIKF